MVLFDVLFGIILQTISATSYAGIFLLMAAESMVFPIPSEAVMPFAGFLVASGQMNIILVAVASTLGSIFGSLISYCIGLKGGKPFVSRYGKYFLLNEEHLEKTHRFFEKRGSAAIFFCRFIPVIRHLISIPAGSAKMNLKKFLAFTAIGALLWNMFLVYLGMLLKEQWETIVSYTQYLDIAIIGILVLAVLYFIAKRKRKSEESFV
ncbi:MAG: DedA family protein [Candidatus Aenigmarchaeota archaeon]|nr:DedA family protein [Candidatus Aenigmarchaeota archaeon]